ncbi:transmembrane amino acid transporter protein-domain-containing protein [Chlamydoabsidia padenii]|nr:transmembrane amino acid transporter protein-domain-containing protein [Chlamydoabsidia padenii]
MESNDRYSSSYCQVFLMLDDGSTIRQCHDFKPPPPLSDGNDHFLSWKYLPRNISNTSVLTSIICVVAGSGTLGIPYALSQSGWIGMLFLLISACISHYTGCLIIRCLYLGQPKRLDGFPEIGHATFGRPGQVVGFIFSQLLLFATPIVYFILASGNIADLLASVGVNLDFKVCAWIVSVTVGVPFVMVRNMKDASFMSLVATLASICLILIISVVSTSDYDDVNRHVHHDIAIPRQFPMAFSTFSFSYCGNVIFPQLEGCMRQPRHWSKVMLVATIVITLMYVIIGFVCYMVYGNTVLNPVFLSIPHGYARNIAMIVATIHVLLASPLYLYVFTIRIESWLGLPTNNAALETPDRLGQLHESVNLHHPMTDKQNYFSPPIFHAPHKSNASPPVISSSDGTTDSDNTDQVTEIDVYGDNDDRITSSSNITMIITHPKEKGFIDAIPDNQSLSRRTTANHYIVIRSVRFLEWLCNHSVLARVLLRSLEIATCALIAMLVPYFSDVMNLIGTVAAESLTFVLPCVFFIKLTWQKHSIDKKERQTFSVVLESVVCASIALFGVFCICFGIVDAIAALTRDLSKQN